jgi:hypothetical protein
MVQAQRSLLLPAIPSLAVARRARRSSYCGPAGLLRTPTLAGGAARVDCLPSASAVRLRRLTRPVTKRPVAHLLPRPVQHASDVDMARPMASGRVAEPGHHDLVAVVGAVAGIPAERFRCGCVQPARGRNLRGRAAKMAGAESVCQTVLTNVDCVWTNSRKNAEKLRSTPCQAPNAPCEHVGWRSGEVGKPIDLPYHQLAFLFLEQSLRLSAEGGTVCLLVPSTLLYGVYSSDFRTGILRRWHVPQVIDFTSIRNLFPEGDTKSCAVFIAAKPPIPESSLLHVTPRRTTATKEGLFFEIDAYDFHKISQNIALSDDSIWKANLLGGGRVHSIARRLLDCKETLSSFVKRREPRDGFLTLALFKARRLPIARQDT